MKTPKNIVICCDGTANQFGKNNTNVVKLYERIALNETQVNFYDPGVGTSSGFLLKPLTWLSNKFSQAFGWDLNRNVEEAYWYLMENYEQGDKIFLFGFSRGAHTVRRLAAVLGKCGLLYRGSDNMVPYVIRMYNNREDNDVIHKFRETYTRKCPVHFLGVWDTVSSLSGLWPVAALDGELSKEVKHAYQALAIDEKRLRFPPNIFIKDDLGPDQIVEEVWFAGVHSDVGGSYPEEGLSNISLKWMLDKAIKAGLEEEIKGSSGSIKTDFKDKIHNSWSGFFWFVPWHVYFVSALATLLIVQMTFAYIGLFYNFHARPFDIASEFLILNWKIVSLILVTLVFGTARRRVIPKNSKIHKSVMDRRQAMNYKPTYLEKLIESKQYEVVE